jgi:hypothetical protein
MRIPVALAAARAFAVSAPGLRLPPITATMREKGNQSRAVELQIHEGKTFPRGGALAAVLMCG